MLIHSSWRLPQYGCLECDERQVKCDSLPRSAKYKKYLPSTIMINSPSTSSNCSDATDLSGTPSFQDLELTVQWCTATYRSIATSTSVEKFWQAVPQESIAHPFLTHGLLALSALHVAATSNESREESIKTAQNHYSRAIYGFQKAAKSLDQSTYDAVFAMCHIDLVFCFALPLTVVSPSNNDPIDNLCHILTHLQTSSPTTTATTNPLNKESALNPLHPHAPPTHEAQMPNTSQLAITALTRLNNTLSQQDPSHPTSTYTTTITHLASALKTLLCSSSEETTTPLSTMQWAYHVPGEFLPLTRQRRPFALVLLAHFAVILHAMRASWWVGEWGERVIRQCGLVLGSKGELRGALGWVVDATGVFVG
ncbi:hypothetical protein BDW42DRAFT_181035 [Aspergillus taichungensis]|uniref:Zn(2)-C6 fungal-type domain-containing protein n=1 Tax=Aspergillus taichungensis TaxID=482145 RepID=A0A2J5HEP6_9EURO|nr:hypothetical protein BDW42DRAFT_181035 [Aspergillus taichungensis]